MEIDMSPSKVRPGRVASALLFICIAGAVGCGQEPQAPTEEPATELAALASGALAFRMLSSGGSHVCGVTTDERAYCWGENNSGQLGNGLNDVQNCNTTPCNPRPVAVLGGLRFRQLSAGTRTARMRPVPVGGTLRFRQVAAGESHTCAISTADVAYCWGLNTSGQLGDGTTLDRLRPVRVADGRLWRHLSGGNSYTCGVTTTDRGYCWGLDLVGSLGNGPAGSSNRPVAVAGGHVFRRIEAGRHTCGITRTYQA